MKSCKACNAPILWAYTGKGKAIPLDPQPIDGGNISIEVNAGIVRATVGQPHPGGYVSHFVTCPQASSFRRRER